MEDAKASFLEVKRIFHAAGDLAGEEREAFLVIACGEDAKLRREVDELLASAEACEADFLGAPRRDAPLPRTDLPACPEFAIISREAVGTHGIVYRAVERSSGRSLAIKVLRADAADTIGLRRFSTEASILARLHHPAIARLVASNVESTEAGETRWIATEWVDGLTLGTYAELRGPSIHEVLSIFATVCDAVAHAHELGVVHRDLKPANVMVDALGSPRVLDFGIAQMNDRANADASARTRTGTVVGTLAYMAPEQARGDHAKVGPRSDVYALGAMLFELLTARSPLDVRGLDLLTAIRVVADAEPLRLRDLRPDLPPGLDLVLARALEKAPEHRYADAAELRDDVRRLLDNRAVRATRPGLARRLQRFVRRNRAVTAAAVGLAFVLLSALASSLHVLRGERRLAQETGATLEWLARRLLERSPDLQLDANHERDLDDLRRRIERHLAEGTDAPAMRATLALVLGEMAGIAQARGDLDAQRSHAERALEVRTGLLRDDPGDLASRVHLSTLHAKLGEAARDRGDLGQRDRHNAAALASDEALVLEHPDDLELIEDLGWSLERCQIAAAENGDHETAERLCERRLADAEQLAAADPTSWKYAYNLTHALYFAAGYLVRRGEQDRVLSTLAACEAQARRACELAPGRRDLLLWWADMARAVAMHYRDAGDACEALQYAELALSLAEQVATADPRRLPHLDLLMRAAGEEAVYAGEAGRPDAGERGAAALSRIARLLPADDSAKGRSRLEETAAELTRSAHR